MIRNVMRRWVEKLGVSYSVNSAGPSHPTQLDGTRLEAPVPPPRRWVARRPGDFVGDQPRGEMLGDPGPDAGYVLKLISRAYPKLGLADGESRHDVEAALSVTALRRSSLAGRAPVEEDVEWAAIYWGMLPGVGPVGDQSPCRLSPGERAHLFGGSSHEFELQREIAARPQANLIELKPDQLVAGAMASLDGGRRSGVGGNEDKIIGPPVRRIDVTDVT